VDTADIAIGDIRPTRCAKNYFTPGSALPFLPVKEETNMTTGTVFP
jgi:hypothetical protein